MSEPKRNKCGTLEEKNELGLPIDGTEKQTPGSLRLGSVFGLGIVLTFEDFVKRLRIRVCTGRWIMLGIVLWTCAGLLVVGPSEIDARKRIEVCCVTVYRAVYCAVFCSMPRHRDRNDDAIAIVLQGVCAPYPAPV
ncbi:unnamed protein product [Discosporangium mesarthrocarpum]